MVIADQLLDVPLLVRKFPAWPTLEGTSFPHALDVPLFVRNFPDWPELLGMYEAARVADAAALLAEVPALFADTRAAAADTVALLAEVPALFADTRAAAADEAALPALAEITVESIIFSKYPPETSEETDVPDV